MHHKLAADAEAESALPNVRIWAPAQGTKINTAAVVAVAVVVVAGSDCRLHLRIQHYFVAALMVSFTLALTISIVRSERVRASG